MARQGGATTSRQWCWPLTAARATMDSEGESAGEAMVDGKQVRQANRGEAERHGKQQMMASEWTVGGQWQADGEQQR